MDGERIPEKKQLAAPKRSDIHEGHRQRMKLRFRRDGLDHFQPHEVLEALLYFGIPQGNTNPLAHNLIRSFGSFSAVLEADYNDLIRVKGIGEHTATLITMLLPMFRYYENDRMGRKVVLDDNEKLAALLCAKFLGIAKEAILLLALDGKGTVLYCDFVFQGGIDSVMIYEREICDIVTRTRATAVILAHNHPNGLVIPSSADLDATVVIGKVLKVMKVQLLDHFIVSMKDALSMREYGYFAEIENRMAGAGG